MPWSDDPLNNVPKQSFEDAARLAAEVCRTAHAVICLHDIGRLQVHASYSVAGHETQLQPVVCAETPVPERLLVVPDLQQDPALRDSALSGPKVGARFYVAAPLLDAQGSALGALCLFDPAPRPDGLTAGQQECLSAVARQIATLLDLRRAGQRYRDQKLLHDRILASATDYAIIAMDKDGRITRWNTGAERILGWREEEILGDPAHVIFTPEDRAAGRPETEMALARRDGRAPDERWHLRKGGERFFANGEMMPLLDERGTSQGFLKILRDRTQQRADDAALHKVQDQLRLAVAATDLGIFDYDLITGDLGWDARVCALFGLPPDAEVSYEIFLAGLHPDDRSWVDEAVKATLDPAGDGTYDIAYRTVGLTDGVERWISAKGQAFFVQGRPVRFIGTVRDISASRRAEQTLQETEERYRLAARATNDAIWDWNLVTNQVLWNEALTVAYGHQPGALEPTGEWWLAHIHPDDRNRVSTSIHAVIDGTGTSWSDEYRFLRADGSYADILDRGYVLRDEAGNGVRMIGAMLDITARKRAEEHQRLLTAELQHRVKNTLAMVQAIASQTLRGATDLEEAREGFAARLISLGRAHDILTQASWTAAPITEVVEGALSVHRQTDAARLRVSGPNVLLGAKPALALALALHELATNAAKYGALSGESGVVDLRWHVVHEGEQPRFCLTWSETGGPPILAQPTRRGFGSRLIERSFASEVGGEVKLTYAPTGLVCRLEAPLTAMQGPLEAAAA
ncbi:MAG: PAS domain-containing protein [Rhodospirillales bacterium]|nr:PAS domain-containing protein [Acetobacter sp.]